MLPNYQNTGSISFGVHGQRTKIYQENKDRITEKIILLWIEAIQLYYFL